MNEGATSSRDDDALSHALRWLFCATAAAGLLTLLVTCAYRVGWPYPLEWMEGTSLQHALWLARGELPYAAPSAELIAYVYPPLAYLPPAVASMLLGPSLPAARALSLAFTLGTLALLGVATARHAHNRVAGLFSAGLFAYGFGYGGAFLDLVRVDAVFVLCIAAAVERLSARRNAAALGWLVASALAKQHGAVLLLAVSLALLAHDRKSAARGVGAAWLAFAVACGALQLASGGWFARYTLEVPSRHGLEPHLLATFVLIDMMVYLPVLTISAALALGRRVRALEPLDALALAAVAVSALGRAHPGGDDNVRLPAFALLCVVGAAPLVSRALESPRPLVRIGLSLALCLQAAVLWQPPSLHAPLLETARRFVALDRELARCAAGGPAVALDYGLITGKPFIHTMALSDLRLGGASALSVLGTNALLDALRGPRAPHAIAVGERFAELQRVLDERYTPCAELPAPRLPTGYQPGLRVADGELRQQVYALRQR